IIRLLSVKYTVISTYNGVRVGDGTRLAVDVNVTVGRGVRLATCEAACVMTGDGVIVNVSVWFCRGVLVAEGVEVCAGNKEDEDVLVGRRVKIGVVLGFRVAVWVAVADGEVVAVNVFSGVCVSVGIGVCVAVSVKVD